MLFCREFGFVAIYALSGNILGSTLAPRKVLKIISSVVMYILSFSLRMKFSKGKAHLKRSKVDDVEIGLESTTCPPPHAILIYNLCWLSDYKCFLLIELFPDCGSHDYMGASYWSVWLLHKLLYGYVVSLYLNA